MDRKTSLPLEYWGLERWPFRSVRGFGELYPSGGHNEALARLDYLVAGGRRLGVLLGGAGMGKSLTLRAAQQRLVRQARAVVLVDALGATSRELLWHTAAGLGTAPQGDDDVPRLWRQVADRIVENRLQQSHSVLLIDDAGHAGPDVVTQIARLTRVDPSPAARWTIVLAAEPAQAARWNETLRGLVDLRIELRPWEAEETAGYVQMALVDAGRVEPLFDEEALAALHELSRGVPREVARLADFALLAGAAAGLVTIDVRTVEAAYDELAWPATEAAL